MKYKQLLILVIIFCFLLGCSSDSGKNKVFRYDMKDPILNLDPQYTTDYNSHTLIYNTFEGLVRSDLGNISVALAEDYKKDNLKYTFYLDKDAMWSNQTPVVADDFVFAFERLFISEVKSPYADSYTCIKNASDILNGTMSVDNLGVKALDAHTLEFELEYDNPFFLEMLSSPSAMPCKREFFLSTNGRYGLAREFLIYNGPFTIAAWDNKKYIQIKRNDNYNDEVYPSSIYFYIGRDNTTDLFFNGKNDGMIIDYTHIKEIEDKKLQTANFDNTTWALTFNMNSAPYNNKKIRQGLVLSIDRNELINIKPDNLTVTSSFVPPAVMMLEKSYRERAAELVSLYDPKTANTLFQQGLAELGYSKLPKTTVIIPDNHGFINALSILQQFWQEELTAYINFEALPTDEVVSRVQRGDFQMAVYPFTPSASSPDSVLEYFSSSKANFTGYTSFVFNDLLNDAKQGKSIDESVNSYKKAEMELITSGAIAPLYYQTSYYVFGKGVTGLKLSPFAGNTLYRFAEK